MSKPIKKIKCGYVSAAVFENESNGKKFQSFTFQKSYKDKDGKWKNTDNYSEMDLPSLAILINRLASESCRVQVGGDSETLSFERPQSDNTDVPF